MRCDDCKNWTTARVTRYADGSEVFNWRAPEGKGRCSVLEIDTSQAFGCISFIEAPSDSIHILANWKSGAPWQHWVDGPCPDCRGLGSSIGGACNRCGGRSTVRYYDDGFIGTNQTLLHPKEKEKSDPLRCRNCKEPVNTNWVACPLCGIKLMEPVAETEYVGRGNAGGVYGKDGTRKTEVLCTDIDAMNERDRKVTTLRRMTTENGCSEQEAKVAQAMADKIEATPLGGTAA